MGKRCTFHRPKEMLALPRTVFYDFPPRSRSRLDSTMVVGCSKRCHCSCLCIFAGDRLCVNRGVSKRLTKNTFEACCPWSLSLLYLHYLRDAQLPAFCGQRIGLQRSVGGSRKRSKMCSAAKQPPCCTHASTQTNEVILHSTFFHEHVGNA